MLKAAGILQHSEHVVSSSPDDHALRREGPLTGARSRAVASEGGRLGWPPEEAEGTGRTSCLLICIWLFRASSDNANFDAPTKCPSCVP